MAKKKSKYYVRPDGLHEAIRIVNGKRKAFRGKTDAEVERKMIEYQAKVSQGRSFREVSDAWAAEHLETLEPNTLRNYRAPIRRVTEHFADTPIRQISAPDVKRFIDDFAGRGYAKKTVMTQRLIANMIFGYAVESGDLEQNPCTCVSIPKGLRKTYRMPASAEDEAIINTVEGLWLFPFFILYSGLRKGEALALQGRDLDVQHQLISVTKSIYHDQNGRPHVKQPKTSAGCRKVPLLRPVMDRLPRGLKADDYLFSCDGGATPLSETEYDRLWREYAKATGIQCTAHQLRHSYASLLLDLGGLELKDRQTILGHASSAMTEDVYTHISDARQQRVVEALNKRLSGET